MGKRTFIVEVCQTVEVTLDEGKFDDAFMSEFRESFYQFDTIEEHAKHLAQLEARGIYELGFVNPFVEGYGHANDMGISASVLDVDTDISGERAS